MGTSAIAELTAGFEEPFRELGRDAARDRDAVVISWPSVPVEIIRAAGFQGSRRSRRCRADAGGGRRARAGALPEPAASARRGRTHGPARAGCRDRAAAHFGPRLQMLSCIYASSCAAASSRELPPVLLFDLLQSGGADVPSYDAARTSELLARLAHISQHGIPPMTICAHAIGAANTARAAARRLDALRRSEPRIGGLEALPLLGAFWHLAPERYAVLADAAVDTIAARAPLAGPRAMLAGVPVDSTALHAAIESQGAIVVTEISPFGAAGRGRRCRHRVRSNFGDRRALSKRARSTHGRRSTALERQDRKRSAGRRRRRDLAAARRCELRLGLSAAAPAARAALGASCGARRRSAPADRRVGSRTPRSARRRFEHGRRHAMAEKQLESTVRAAAFQKEWFGELRRRVFDERQPYALVQADVPFELFDLLDIPAVSNQWWSSLVAAKRQAPAFLDAMTRRRRSGTALPLLQPRARDDALQRSGRSAVGRAADAALALRAPDLRLRSPRLFALGRGVRRRALRDRPPGRDRAAAALVGARPASMARARRAASARIRRGNARAARRKARSDQRAAPGPRGAARDGSSA